MNTEEINLIVTELSEMSLHLEVMSYLMLMLLTVQIIRMIDNFRK